jgi:hypothetical protein
MSATNLKPALPANGFLGLDRIVSRLIAEDGFESYTSAMRSIAEYEKFFLLAARHRNIPHVPSSRVDIVWQRHMLDTLAYAEDCARWAGAFLHRIDEVPPDGYRQTLDRLGTADLEIWDQPGPASISALKPDPITRGERHSSLEKEDFSALLARVRASLQNKPGLPAWVAEARELLEADSMLAVEEYRRFLGLLITEAAPLTPSKLLDEFWHQHVLDSRNYASFCTRTAGRFLHHIPNYEKPHKFHAPAFRRTHALYREKFGNDPPGRVWSYMGESGGCGSPPAPPPLYVIDNSSQMRADLRIGGVDQRHLESLHPILAKNGLPNELWLSLIREIDSVPQISWSKFSAIKANSPLLWGLILGTLLIAHIKTGLYGNVILGGFSFGIIIYSARWIHRAYDQTRIVQIINDFNSVFGKYGASLSSNRQSMYIRCSASTISD